MSGPSSYRDSTQIVLPWERLDGLRCELESEFTVTIREEDETVRIIGSPVVIKRVSQYLVRHGVSLP